MPFAAWTKSVAGAQDWNLRAAFMHCSHVPPHTATRMIASALSAKVPYLGGAASPRQP
jgi:hypothetical protein